MAKCGSCGAPVIHVRDNFTGATFPVDATPAQLRGFVLSEPGEGERNQRADQRKVEVHQPHNLSCTTPPAEDAKG